MNRADGTESNDIEGTCGPLECLCPHSSKVA